MGVTAPPSARPHVPEGVTWFILGQDARSPWPLLLPCNMSEGGRGVAGFQAQLSCCDDDVTCIWEPEGGAAEQNYLYSCWCWWCLSPPSSSYLPSPGYPRPPQVISSLYLRAQSCSR